MKRKLVAWLIATIMVLAIFATALPVSAASPNKTALTINAPSSVNRLQTFDIYGKLVYGTNNVGLSDVTISVYKSTDGKKWDLVGTCLTNSGGYYTISTSENIAGHYIYKALFAGNRVNQKSSATTTLTVESLTATSLTLTVNPNLVYIYDSAATIKATLKTISGTAISGQTVRIVISDANGVISDTPYTTDPNGVIQTQTSKSVSSPTTLSIVAVFDGSIDYAPVTSNTVQFDVVGVATTITLTLNPEQVNSGTNFAFSGSLKDADGNGISGQYVDISVYLPDQKGWGFVDSTYTDGAGSYYFSVPFDAGTYNFRARFENGGLSKYLSSTSNVVTGIVV